MTERSSTSLYIAHWLIGWIVAGTLLIGFDFAFHILPNYPALQTVHAAPWAAKLAYVACAPVGMATLYLAWRKPLIAFWFSLALPIVFVPAYVFLWHRISFLMLLAMVVPFLIAHHVFSARPGQANRNGADFPAAGK